MRCAVRWLFAILMVISAGCDNGPVGSGGPAGSGQIILAIPGHPPEVVALKVTLSLKGKDTVRTTIPLPGPSQPVFSTISNLPAGTWRLELRGVGADDVVLYAGGAEMTVVADSSETAGVVFIQPTGVIEVVPGHPTACTEPNAGIVSWWPGENSTGDVVDTNNGTIGWPGVSYAPGVVGRAFRFDGVSGQIRVPDNPHLRITGSLTIEGWILAEGYPEGRASGQILFRGDNRVGIDPYFLAMLPDGRLWFHVASISAQANLQTPGPVSRGIWHHVAAVLDAGTGAMTLFVDGSIAVAMTTTVRPFRDLDPSYEPGLGIGNTQSSDLYHDQPFHGAIDELSIYASALDQSQVNDVYRARREGKCRPGGPPPDSIMVSTFARGFVRPAGLVFSSSGQLLVADFWNPGFIYSVTQSGVVDTFAWGPGRAVAALARDASGYIYGTYQDGTVKRAAPGGGALRTFISGIANPAGIAVHPNGRIYVADADSRTVNAYAADGSPVATIPVDQTQPVGLAIHPNGTVFFADRTGHRVMKIDGTGNVTTFVSGIPSPHDMAFDTQGRLFVTGGNSSAGNNVYVVTPSGAISEIPYGFDVPVGITFDASGNLYISNYGADFVSKVVFPR